MNVDVEYLASPNWDASMRDRLAWLRENEPVFWSEKDGLWIVTSYAGVEYVSKHQELFTSNEGVRPMTPAKLGLIDEPEPRHGQLRRLINRGFTPRMVAQLEKVFREITTECIDKVGPAGECDFVESISVPLPLLLIAEMIGIRKEDRERFHHWSDSMIAGDGNFDNPEIMAKAAGAYVEYAQYVTEIIEDRRANPRDDLVSILTGAKDEGFLQDFESTRDEDIWQQNASLANDELIKMLVLLLVAGNETTRNAISGGMQLLIENPDERQKLIDDPSLIPGACEEIVRLVSPVRSFARSVVEDTELGGKKLEKGQWVVIMYGPANRDPKVYDDPDRFDVTRKPAHLGFGIGSHFCLGANLARMEMRVAFEELLRRLPDMEYAEGGPEFQPSALVRTCAEMRVRYTPENRRAA